MTWKDKLEIGLKEDAQYRKDNLPARQARGPEKPAGPGRSAEIPKARRDADQASMQPKNRPKVRKPLPTARVRTVRSKRGR